MDIESNPQNLPDIHINAMDALQKLFISYGFPMCLDGGTLLGAIRDNDFITGDTDVDMFYISKCQDLKSVLLEFENIIKPFLLQNNYEIVPIAWTWHGKKHLMMGQYHIIKDGVSIDVWSGWFDENNKFYLTYAVDGTLDKTDILPLRSYTFKQVDFSIPNQTEKFLIVLYGENWKVPDPNYKTKCNPDFFQKKVLKVIDQFGWAYFFIAKDQQKYSIHNIDYAKIDYLNKLMPIDCTPMEYDVIYFHSPGLGLSKIEQFRHKLKYSGCGKNLKVVGGYGGENPGKYKDADVILSISLNYVPKLRTMYPNKPVIFLPESIDTEYFTPKKFEKKMFRVGFAGGAHRPVKRTWILEKLDHYVTIQSQHGKEFFTIDRTQDHMKKFYNNIDVLLLCSDSECMPRCILEAMSCGLPVISTDVGSLRIVLDKEWLVPVNPEEEVVKQINEKLRILEKNPRLRKQVGERNRKTIEKYFSWRKNQPLWDEFFNAVCLDDKEKILKLERDFLEQFDTINIEDYYKDIPIITTEPIEVIKEEKKLEPVFIDQNQTINTLLEEIVAILKSVNKPVYLSRDTCLQATVNRMLSGKTIYLTTTKMSDLDKYTLKLKNYICVEEGKEYTKGLYRIVFNYQLPRKNKIADVNGKVYQVPLPCHPYLQRLFGDNWKEIGKNMKENSL